MNPTRPSRAGISLLEVLISIGILAVGLTSVLSFIPAGHSMAKTSLVTDQAAIVAANAMADLTVQGFLRVDSLSNVTSPVMIDPIGPSTWPGVGFNQTELRQNGVLSVPSAASPPRVLPASAYVFRARDDVSLDVPDSDAIPVTNRFIDGSRSYKGNFSWVALLTRPGGGNFVPGDEATLSIVVFHDRDPSQAMVSLGIFSSGTVAWTAGPLIPSRQNNEVIRTNGVCLSAGGVGPPTFRRIALAAINDGDTGAFIDFDGPPLGAVPLYAVPDAVAVIQKTVTLEGSSPYSE
jgi:hypothetical protein